MHKFYSLLLLLLGITTQAQIKGNVTAIDGQGIPFVSITIENTYTGTTANEFGQYELPLKATGKYTMVFQSIGFKTKKVPVNISSFPHTLDVTLEDETYELKTVTVSNTEDPAYEIIRQAIAHKKENSEKTGRYESDFYSKGIFRVKDLPKKILGQEVEMPEGMVDSTGSGILYLSETVSHITFEQPDNLKERIVASKISGNDKGFSYNTAMNTNYNFYNNYVNFNINMVSPLANNAMNYYKFKLEGSTFDDNGNQINKIKLIPRRDKEPVFEGYIYIVDDSWAIYAVDVDIKGYRMQEPILETLNLQQNFSYNSNNRIWSKNSQTLDFKAGLFGIIFTGKFTHVFTNYVFHESFDKKTFGKEIVFIEEEANKKDASYWDAMRPVPLTDEEVRDYVKKDSIQTLHESEKYLDSIDRKTNKFGILDPIMGYTYKDSKKKFRISYDGIFKIPQYNTVQGWNTTTDVSFSKRDEDKKSFFAGSAIFNYGIAEDRLRVSGWLTHSLGKKGGSLYVIGGNTIEQFNPDEPISPLINSVSTLFFKDNYMKLYDKTFARIQYTNELTTGVNLYGSVEYLRRRGLLNNADWVLLTDEDDDYTSNNPLDPGNLVSLPFETHTLYKASIGGTIRFGMKYITRPDGKIPVADSNYPTIAFRYEKAFAGSNSEYEYDFVAARVMYNETFGNKGDFGINLKAGKFFNAEGIAFADYKHFNGNQTHVGTAETYLNNFNLLPYYSHSTNDSYFETHVEHNFKGYIMNKIPLLNLLQWNLIVGYHNIATPDYKPYHEATVGFDNIGFGKFRFIRVDYVRAYQGGFQTDGVVFGLKFLDLL